MSHPQHRPQARRTETGVPGAARALPRRPRLAGAVLAALALLACVGVAWPAAAAALPEGRVYEMVSPVYKGGYGVKSFGGGGPEPLLAVAANGESVAFISPGAFAEAPSGGLLSLDYLARRGSSGWSTTPLMPPAGVTPFQEVADLSPTLESELIQGRLGPSTEGAQKPITEFQFLLHSTALPDTTGAWEPVGKPFTVAEEQRENVRYVGASVDFCHVLLNSGLPFLPGASGEYQVYELDRGCNGGSVSLRLVGVDDAGQQLSSFCLGGTVFVGDSVRTQDTFNAVSADGETVFFTDCLGADSDYQVFVRLGGTRTLEISKPLDEGDGCAEAAACNQAAERPSATFAGASEDGSRVFFMTTAALTGEDKDTGNDLYMATIGCPEGEPGCAVAGREVRSLVQVSHDPNGGEAGVQGVVQVAPDGSRVYFVATGDLLGAGARQALEGAGRPLPRVGADNLYVYDAGSGGTSFVGELCSGFERSGSVEDAHCPSATGSDTALWHGYDKETGAESKLAPEAQTAGADGRFLVFSTYAQLVSGDTNATKDVYRYDAQTGALDRVSLGEGGYDANGNGGASDAEISPAPQGGIPGNPVLVVQHAMSDRAISEDGSRIVFTTSRPLSPAATNGLSDVYEWHEQPGGGGSVSLISGGGAEAPIDPYEVVISASGRDIFFVTTQGLVAQDTDEEGDVYDARLGGGFPAVSAPRQPCAGDACQGSLTNPAPLLVPGSVSQAPGENLPVSAAAKSKPSVKAKAKRLKCKQGYVKKGSRCVKRKAAGSKRRAGR